MNAERSAENREHRLYWGSAYWKETAPPDPAVAPPPAARAPQAEPNEPGREPDGTGREPDETGREPDEPDKPGREPDEPSQQDKPDKPGREPNDPAKPANPGRSRRSIPWRPDHGRALAAFLLASAQGRTGDWAANSGADDRIDVRQEPLVVREGTAPGLIPQGRWPSERPLVRSEQFAVDMAIDRLADDGGLFAVHAPPGTGVTEVFGDLVAAIVTQRACRIADLPDPAAAFGQPLPAWGLHVVAAPAAELTGFEIVLTAPEPGAWPQGTQAAGSNGASLNAPGPNALGPNGAGPNGASLNGARSNGAGPYEASPHEAGPHEAGTEQGGRGHHGNPLDSLLVNELRPVPPVPAPALPPLGARWRDRAAAADYFPATARLAGDDEWAMLVARLGDRAATAGFADRFWQGMPRGTDALFRSGESMAAALRRLADDDDKAVDWPAAVARFRSALAKAETLASERTAVSAALTRLSSLEMACEEASCAAEAAQAGVIRLRAREPEVSARVLAAEQELRAHLADLGAHEISRPSVTTVTPAGVAALRSREALSVAVAGGLRRGRNWRSWAVRRRELRGACAAAERRRDAAAADAAGFRAGLAAAEDAAAAAAAEVTRIAAELGPAAEAIVAARQRWGDHVPDGPAQAETEDAALIEWRETAEPWADEEFAAARAEVFFTALELHKALITARVEVIEANLAALMDLLRGDRPAQEAPAPAGSPAVLAAWQTLFLVVPVVQVPFSAVGPLFDGLGTGLLGWLLADHAESLPLRQALGALRRADRAVFAGDTVATKDSLSTRASALRVAERNARHGTWIPAHSPVEGTARYWVATPLRVARGLDRATIDQRNEETYDGLLIPDRD